MNQRDLAQLEKEEKELEEALFGAPESTETTEESAAKVPEVTEETPTKVEELVAPEPKPVTDEPQEPTREKPDEDWEKRYKNLRNSRDQKLYKAKSQLAGALETVGTLQQQVADLKALQPALDPFKGIFTDEDKETLGDTTVDALQKATKRATEAATKPLQDQLEAERKLREKQDERFAEQNKQEVYDIFISRVARAVPDWQDIDLNPEFKDFMSEPEVDGLPRSEHFLSAENRGDAASVIRYMSDFKATQGKAKPDPLADKLTPTGESAGSTQTIEDESEPEYISRAHVDKFYDDLNRGRYDGRHSEALAEEKRIDLATAEGRVR